MPKYPISYTNTVIYEIRGDIINTNKYIGYTTNYRQKKSFHRRNVEISDAPMYVDIRENGGWDAWLMQPIKMIRNKSIDEIRENLSSYTQHSVIQELAKTDYNCDICHCKFHRQFEYTRHCKTNKHIKLEIAHNTQKEMDANAIIVKNNKIQAQMLEVFKDTRNEITILQSNIHELKQQVVELSSKPQQLTQNTQNTQIVQQNTQNNSFNVQIFLNEQCGKAMNLSDFLKIMKITNEDLVNNVKVGFVDGMAAIIIREMCEKLTIFERPVHCTDLKRETVFYKEDGKWHKENGDVVVQEIMCQVSRDCVLTMIEWRKTNPDANDRHSEFNTFCDKLPIAIVAGSDRDTLFPKTMKQVYKHCLIDKKAMKEAAAMAAA